jgi:hypothetical protein
VEALREAEDLKAMLESSRSPASASHAKGGGDGAG